VQELPLRHVGHSLGGLIVRYALAASAALSSQTSDAVTAWIEASPGDTDR
jgi:hypothetical protein